jgi:hypothetical protein
MRVDIKTSGRVKDKDIRALYLLKEALRISSPEMSDANLQFCGLRKIKNLSEYK